MPRALSSSLWSRPSLHFILLCAFFMVLWIAGGASRADALGQAVVRFFAALILGVLAWRAPRPVLGKAFPVVLLLGSAIVLALLYLIPLPPELWQSLPGRELFVRVADLTAEPQPWRAASLVPSDGWNAALSLIVPVTTLLLLMGLREDEMRYLTTLLLGMVAASTLVGLLQFSGGGFNNPFVNELVGAVSGMFANRNHYALFLAFGGVAVPAWVFSGEGKYSTRGIVGLGFLALVLLTILATGSRTGMVVGVIGLCIGCLLVWKDLQRKFNRYPRWMLITGLFAVAVFVAALVSFSIYAQRAVAVDRLLSLDMKSDFRTVARPTLDTMLLTYFPVGSGFGGFDAKFRIFEPIDLLKPSYYNHAHNDWLEIVLDGGILGLLLLLAAVGWWAWMSFQVWFLKDGAYWRLPRLGSSLLFLIFLASGFDYPARTPMMMAMVVVAAVWLASGQETADAGDRRAGT